MTLFSRKEYAWILYDFGNSAYALLIMTLFYPLYYSQFVSPGQKSDLYWGLTVSISILLVGLMSPFMGAYTDNRTNRKSFFILFSILSALGTIFLAITGTGHAWLGSLVFIAVNFSFGMALFLYDSFLVVIPHKKNVSTTISGLGWAIGYIGGPICLLLAWFILGGKLPISLSDYNFLFIVTGLFFLLCIIWPIKVFPKDVGSPDSLERFHFVKTVSRTVRRKWEGKKKFFLFLFAMYFIMDGLTTIVYFTSLYAKNELGFSIGQIVMLLLIVQFVAVPATVILCWLGEKKGEVKFIIFCTILWCLIVVLMFFYSSYQYYYFIAAATGLVIGSTPALGRGYLSKIIPKEKRAELFGFNAFASKIATIFGPVVFGFVSVRLNMRIALLTVIPFFVIGVILLLFLQNQIKKEVC